MKQLYFLILTNFLALSVFSQYYPPAIEWQKTIGTFAIDQFNAVIPTTDGGYIAAGETHGNDLDISDNHGGVDALIVKYDATGVMQWHKCYGGTLDDGAYSMKQTIDGGFVVAGYSNSSNGDLNSNQGFADAWVFKISSSGLLQWQKSYGTTSNDAALSIKMTNDGGYIFAGQVGNDNGDAAEGGFKGLADVWVVKLSISGTIEWQRCYGSSHGEAGFDIKQTLDGGYIFVGYATFNDGDVSGVHTGGPNPFRRDMWIVKINNIGAITWQKCLGGENSVSPTGFADDEAYAVEQSNDSGYILVGITSSIDGDVTNYHGGIRDGWIIKLSHTGDLLWQKTLGGSSDDYIRNIIRHPDGGFVLCGYTASGDGDLAGQPLRANIDGWLIKIDSFGNIQWQRMLRTSGIDGANNIAITPGDGIIVGGYASFNDIEATGNSTWGTNPNAWIIKLSAQVLPLSLTNFRITQINEGIVLKWQTTNEVNFSHFVVERSSDGYSFSAIASIASYNSGGLSKLYSCIDKDLPAVSKIFYRLKLVDKDGSYTYSSFLITAGFQQEIIISPNPTQNLLNIRSKTPVTQTIVTDAMGRILLIEKRANINTLNVSMLPAGQYYIKIIIDREAGKIMTFLKK